ncbi:ThiF family adenylyltransferase [Serinibacter salmoneus]|uniref:Adenylyltransferase/sulfurtransferase n=1 Tax=Serinibacter salmoneus TaxID=556530 RepID=A0A2A9D4Z0_9MICO|nr:ThiF family adenylyltransferase [Serinibacter salmoneus]PFG21022.1 adenylyltransferase/sulfurtransferase [Serinibacter salmoneus]
MALPPIVEPAPSLSAAEAERTARHTRMPELGEIGQRRLAAARVLVLGAGGLGAPALLYLAAAGVGEIGVIDDDDVDASNLHRQVIHGTGDVGEPKTASAARRMREVAPQVRVTELRTRLVPENAADLLRGWDVVLDGTDTFATRYLVADTCADLGVPLVWGSVLRFDAQVSVFWSTPPAPAVPVGLRDLFPAPPAPGTVPSCAEAGVLGALCGMVGSMMATEAVKLITGIGEALLGRVAVVDGLAMRVHEVPLVPSSSSPRGFSGVGGEGEAVGPPSAQPFDGAGALVDVREGPEFREDALAGAVHLSVAEVEQTARRGPTALRELLIMRGVDPDAPVRTYCSAGIRATRAARALQAAGVRAEALPPAQVEAMRAREVRA